MFGIVSILGMANDLTLCSSIISGGVNACADSADRGEGGKVQNHGNLLTLYLNTPLTGGGEYKQRQHSCQYSYVVPMAVCTHVLYTLIATVQLSFLSGQSEHRIHPGDTTHTHTHSHLTQSQMFQVP